MAIRTFQYRLYPTKAQKKALQLQLEVSRHVYNMALEERKLAWELEEKSAGKREGYQYKKTFPQSQTVHSHVLQAAIEDLDKAFQAFFRRVKATGRVVGIDMGINALITTSEGQQVHNPRWYREAQAQLRRQRHKRLLAVQRQHEHIRNQRKDFFDKLVYQLVHTYDVIVIEALKIRNRVKNRHLSKSILDAGWGYFRQRLLDKAADAGREVVLVDPAHTSKSCSNCGTIFEGLTLAHRRIEYLKTGRTCP